MSDTRTALMDAAERLFAERGLASTVREITGAAGANTAAIHYHFGNKHALLQAVCARRMRPLNAARIEGLRALAERAETPSLEEILRAFLRPAFGMFREHPDFMRLLGRMQVESDETRALIYRDTAFETLITTLRQTLPRALPQASTRELYWRVHFIVGALHFSWTSWQEVPLLSGGRVDRDDDETMLARLVDFGAAGLRAGERFPEEPT